MTETYRRHDAGHDQAAYAPVSESGGFHLDFDRYRVQILNLKYWLLGIVALGLLLGLVLTLLSPELFRATARVEITRVVTNVTDVEPVEVEGGAQDLQYYTTQYELLESRFMAERVADAGNLARDPLFLESFNIEGGPEMARDIERALLENAEILPVEDSSLVDIRFSSKNPQLSQKVANLWAEQFLEANYEKRFGANIDARRFLEGQIDELRARLATAERELVDYANANQIIVLNPLGEGEDGAETATQTLVGAELSSLSAALARASAERIAAQALVSAGARDPASDNAAEAALRGRLAGARSELAQLQATFGPEYPEVQSKRAEVNALERALAQEGSLGRGDVQARYRAAVANEQQMRAQLEQAKQSFLGQQVESIQYGILKREVDTTRQLYDALLQRYKELEAAGVGKNNMTLIEEAQAPTEPYSPSLLRNLLFGAFAGLIAAALTVYLRELFDQTIRDPHDVFTPVVQKMSLCASGTPVSGPPSPRAMRASARRASSRARSSVTVTNALRLFAARPMRSRKCRVTSTLEYSRAAIPRPSSAAVERCRLTRSPWAPGTDRPRLRAHSPGRPRDGPIP